MKYGISTNICYGFNSLFFSVLSHEFAKLFLQFHCFVPGRQERSQVPRISGHAEMVFYFDIYSFWFNLKIGVIMWTKQICTKLRREKFVFATIMKLSGDWFCIFSARRRGDCFWLPRWNCQGCLEAFSSKSLQKEIISLKTILKIFAKKKHNHIFLKIILFLCQMKRNHHRFTMSKLSRDVTLKIFAKSAITFSSFPSQP